MEAVDVMGFAGSMAAGVDQAGFDIIAKREPAKFGGFGVESLVYNMPWVEAQVSAPEEWALPAEPVELVYGCPPCSGFSQLSSINTKVYAHTGTTYRGADAEINECMQWLIDYAADAKPRAVVMESVGPAFRLGRGWMEELFARLRERSGLDYKLSHVNMDARWVGGDVHRPRYFFVATLDRFGTGLEFVTPRTFAEVVGDLDSAEGLASPGAEVDTDWGHVTRRTRSTQRVTQTIEWLHERGLDWAPGSRLPDNLPEDVLRSAPDFWRKPEHMVRATKRDFDPRVYSHWFSTDPFSPTRWRADRPFGVVVAASLDRAIHPTEPRPLTFREAARFMSIPDTWSMRVFVEKNKPDELGKAVPSASAKWIAHWVRMAIEGTPGEYAGEDTGDPNIRVFNLQKEADIRAIWHGRRPQDAYWPESIQSDPSPDRWIIDREARPGEWWQRSDDAGIFTPHRVLSSGKTAGPEPADRGSTPRPGAKASSAPARHAQSAPASRDDGTRSPIVRVEPEEFQALLDSLGMDHEEAAKRLGVSKWRVSELTDVARKRPGSFLNAARWDQVQEVLRG